jgi:hypothetical protein
MDIPPEYKDLGDKVEAYAEGVVGAGWLWVCQTTFRGNH